MTVALVNKKIIKDWIDYNGHMNLSYYILVFDMGAEIILSKFKMGEHSAKTTKKSTMVVETHTNYILSLIHISEPTRLLSLGVGGVGE